MTALTISDTRSVPRFDFVKQGMDCQAGGKPLQDRIQNGRLNVSSSFVTEPALPAGCNKGRGKLPCVGDAASAPARFATRIPGRSERGDRARGACGMLRFNAGPSTPRVPESVRRSSDRRSSSLMAVLHSARADRNWLALLRTAAAGLFSSWASPAASVPSAAIFSFCRTQRFVLPQPLADRFAGSTDWQTDSARAIA